MARRKDHSPEELKKAIRAKAEKLIYTKGLDGLTARALAREIGYTPGTIYNFFRDMDALVTEVNYKTLTQLHGYCVEKMKEAKPGYESVKALAYAYIDFAHGHERAWRTLFIETNRSARTSRLPAHYKECLGELFGLIEATLKKNLGIPVADAAHAARVLWACIQGITSLTLDGRLAMIGIDKPHAIVDDLLSRYLKDYVKA